MADGGGLLQFKTANDRKLGSQHPIRPPMIHSPNYLALVWSLSTLKPAAL